MDDIVTFTTRSGSTYELDRDNKRIRRLEGAGAPTPHQGPDGDWRGYLAISLPEVGAYVMVIWGLAGDVVERTVTSDVVSVGRMALS